MFRAEYGACPKLVWERHPWNVRRSSKPFLDGQPPLGRVCCISTKHLLYSRFVCIVSLGRPLWTSLELGDYHAPSILFCVFCFAVDCSCHGGGEKVVVAGCYEFL